MQQDTEEKTINERTVIDLSVLQEGFADELKSLAAVAYLANTLYKNPLVKSHKRYMEIMAIVEKRFSDLILVTEYKPYPQVQDLALDYSKLSKETLEEIIAARQYVYPTQPEPLQQPPHPEPLSVTDTEPQESFPEV